METRHVWTPNLKQDRKLPKRTLLVEAIVGAIESGELPHGHRLPPHRELAHRLSVSVQTVSASYQEVQRRGLIRSIVGSGSYVVGNNPEKDGNFILAPEPTDGADLSIILPAYTKAHEQAARKMMTRLGQSDNAQWMRPSRPIAGLPRHREAAATWLRTLGVELPAEQIFLTNGATHGIFIALAVVARPGDVVLTERLTENGIIDAANVLGLTLKGLETDEQGILPDALEAACAKDDVAALVWVPSLGNPTTHLALEERRRRIAEIAECYDIAVIEDEIYKPLLEEDLPPITRLLPKKGFFVTGLSKSVMTGLRVGYLAAPGHFALRIASILRATTWNAAPLLTEVAAQWLQDGTADTLIQTQRQEAKRRQAILQDILGSHVALTHPVALSAWLNLPAGWNENAMITLLRERQILVTSSAPFRVGPEAIETGIRLCLSSPPTPEMLSATLRQIRDVFEQLPAMDMLGG